jgi:hypothetical protein
MSRLCQSGVRRSNEKSRPLLGLFACEFARRVCDLGQLAEGEGFEPAVRSFGA